MKVTVREMRFETKFAEAIGGFAIAFAELEGWIDASIHEMLRLDPEPGHILTSSIQSVSVRLDIAQALATRLLDEPEDSGLVVSSVEATRMLNAKRNAILHDRWGGFTVSSHDPEPRYSKARMRAERRRGHHWQMLQFTVPEIVELKHQCAAISGAMRPLLVKLGNRRSGGKEGI